MPDDITVIVGGDSAGKAAKNAKKNSNNARNNDKVVVKITKNAVKGRKIEGKIIEVLGHRDEAGMDMLSLVKDLLCPPKYEESYPNFP